MSDRKKKDLWIRDPDGMFMQGDRMYVSNVEELKRDILDEAYISAYAIHPGSTKMYHTVRHFYYWLGMNREIAEYVSRCAICQQEVLGSRLLYSTAYHPQTDGHSKRTIQTLEDMLRSSVLQFRDAWHKHLLLIEFAYNNSFHSSIGMAPFEALYGKPCRTPLGWSEVGERVLVGPKIVDETTQNIQRYVSNPSHVIPPQPLEINPDLTCDEVPVTILDWKDKVLRNKTVRMVKVLRRNHSVEESTWETEEHMRDMYPHLFYGFDL
ncbi:uncharacterized protein [Malus domestica]|uniref:uncharacterized protein n=1 Tax=Malus domestica TaxID=3750 RepID=UPI0004988F7C|nr:uncharacterized protein LOC114819746 [Malus domestica]